jgi:hypothetical protein
MGVLDDAIREHLDLKRARGGDPADIERMEREALGPVRREPTIGSPRVDALDEHASLPLQPDYHEEHLVDLEELQNQGYHDSTAPHPHPHHEHPDPHLAPADGHFEREHDQFAADAEEAEPPRRRFLRRNRPASFSEPVLPPDPGYDDMPGLAHHEPLAQDPPTEHYEPLAHQEPLVEQYEPLADQEPLAEQYEPLAHDEPLPDHPTAPEQAIQPGTPPHLQFEHPPKRPRFSPEPPELQPGADEQAAGSSEPPTELHAAPAPAAPLPAEPSEDDSQVQETTEFDVQKHIAETRHLPDEAPPAPAPPAQAPPADISPAPAPPADIPPAPPPPANIPPAPAPPAEEEDVLEETPEFLQDTPEHDRLWFEQRPPKDFDFDG